MLPYTTYYDVNLRYDEYNQELGINRVSNRLLENDIYLQNTINTALTGDIRELRIANRVETKALTLPDKAISPSTALALSATDVNIYSKSDKRFMTNGKYKTYLDGKQPATLWADLSFQGSFIGSVFPEDATILAGAVAHIGNYDAPDGTLFYVRYVYTHHWVTTHYRQLGRYGKFHRSHWLDYMYQDTYKRVNNNWSLLRRRQTNRI